VGTGQPASDQCAQAGGDLVGAPVHLAGPDRGGELFLIGETQATSGQVNFHARVAASAAPASASLSSSSSRSTMRNALAATLAWKLTCPLVASRTSVSRNSATAATSSAASGRP
jgi:hypothetical protein